MKKQMTEKQHNLRNKPSKRRKRKTTSGSERRRIAKKAAATNIPTAPSYEVHHVLIAEIDVGKRRQFQPKKMEGLKASIAKIGLRTPITIWPVKSGKKKLAAGYHRLKAMESLGRKKIPCVYIKGGKDVARLWEISENLHRAELTVLEESDQTAEWLELVAKTTPTNSGEKNRGPGRPEGLKKKATDELPLPGKTQAAKQKTLDRRLKIAGIDPAAKQAARDAGFADSQTKLSQIAREQTPEDQLTKVKALAKGSGKIGDDDADQADAADAEPPLVVLKREWKKAKKFRVAYQNAPLEDQRCFIIEDLEFPLQDESEAEDDEDENYDGDDDGDDE
jgi:ParB-like chromosome segregation protein Spo0J